MRSHLFVAVAMLAGSPARAADRSPSESPRTITVSGDAEVKVAPDEVSIHLGVESIDKDLGKAKQENDERMRRVIAAARSAGVEEKRIATDQVSVEPHYGNQQSWSGRPAIDGYTVRRSVQVTLREVARFEAVLTATLLAGANVVHDVSFTTTELRKHRDQARSMAMKAAREKAIALAKELDMKPGRPRAITEGGGGFWGGYGAWGGRRGYSQNASQNVGGGGTVEGTMAPGQVSVTASVSIVFDLE
jgi:uncharacterized protein YggE